MDWTRQKPPVEYTVAEWRCVDTSVVVQSSFGGFTVAVWVGAPSCPDVMAPCWLTNESNDVLPLVDAIIETLTPHTTPEGLNRKTASLALRLLAMKDYGDRFDGSTVRMYREPVENPWLEEIKELEDFANTGIRRHRFSLNLEAPTGADLLGRQ